MVDLYPSLGLFPQIDEANQWVASLNFDDTSSDDLALIRQGKMTLLLVLLQILSEFVDCLIFCDRIDPIIISGHV